MWPDVRTAFERPIKKCTRGVEGKWFIWSWKYHIVRGLKMDICSLFVLLVKGKMVNSYQKLELHSSNLTHPFRPIETLVAGAAIQYPLAQPGVTALFFLTRLRFIYILGTTGWKRPLSDPKALRVMRLQENMNKLRSECTFCSTLDTLIYQGGQENLFCVWKISQPSRATHEISWRPLVWAWLELIRKLCELEELHCWLALIREVRAMTE